MRARWMACLIIGYMATPAHAALWGILPVPKESGRWRAEDMVAALELSKQQDAPLYMGVHGWGILEPTKGDYLMDRHLGAMEYAANNGMVLYMGFAGINTTRRDLPKDLESVAWDDPTMLARFEQLLDATKKKLPTIPYIIIGNEVDAYFEKHPGEIDAYLSFYAGASKAVRVRWPGAVVGITVTYEGLSKGGERAEAAARMVKASDAAFFTFYPVFDMLAQPIADVPGHLARLVEGAQGKDIYLQEIGYPSRGEGTSEAVQAGFYATIIPAIEAEARIRVANIFLMHDLDPSLCSGLVGYYGFGDADRRLRTNLTDFLCALGVRRLDGTPKPAWDSVVKGLAARTKR